VSKDDGRIKYVINERRLAYEGAVQIIAGDQEREVITRRERTAARRKAAFKTGAQKAEEQQTVASGPRDEKVEELPVHQTAAERAAAGLIQPDSAPR